MNNAPRIVIENDNHICALCQKHLTVPSRLTPTDDDDVFELNICIMHPSCRKLYDKREKLRGDLTNVEWLIFKKFMG